MIGKQKIWILHIFLLLSLLLAGCTTTDIFESSMITGAAIGVNEPVGMFAAPVVDTLVLNSTDLSNDTNQNLTAYVETSDGDGDSVHNIITWNLNGTPQLLLYYPFEGSNSTIFFSNSTDYAGFNNNMTTKSGSSIRYRISGGYNKSGAWNFSGSNLQRGAGFSTTLGAMNYSVEAWVRTNSSVEHQPILDMGVKDFTFAIANGSIIRIFDGAGAETYFSNDGLTISDNSWHHVAAVREGLGANELKFYLDGVSVGSSTQSTIITNPGTMSIGGDTFSYFYGDIDELKLWNRSLTQQQIQAIFQNQTDVIVSQELNSGDNWTADVTPNDGKAIGDGATARSNQLLVLTASNNLPTVDTLILNSTDLSNDTNQNLTAYATTSDANDDDVKVIYNWMINGSSRTLVNLPWEANGGDNATDFSGLGNGISFSGTKPTHNLSGGFDGKGAYDFTQGDGGEIVLMDTIDPTNYTIEAWIRPTDVTFTGIIARSNDIGPGTSTSHEIRITAGSKFEHRTLDGGGNNLVTGSTTIVAGDWYHVAAVASNNGEMRLFVNGVEEGTSITLGTLDTDFDRYYFGTDSPSGAGRFDGAIDELRIWRTNLSATAIKAIFENNTNTTVYTELTTGQNWTVDATPHDGTNNGTKVRSNQVITFELSDTTTPAVTWVTGDNRNYSLTTFNQTFNVSVFEENNDSVIFVFDNATGNDFNISAFNESGHWTRSINVSGLVEGNHIVTAYVNDSEGNSNNTENLSFTVDFTAPTVTWVNPTNVSNYTVSTGNVSFNITVNDLTAQTILFSFDNATGNNFNVTGINDSGTWYANVNVSGLTEGTTVVTVIANDSVGEINNTEQLTIIVDFTAPLVNISQPINGTMFNLSSGNYTFYVAIKDLTGQSVLLSFDNASGNPFNVTAVNNSGNWLVSVNVSGLANGTHLVTALANDSVGNINWSINTTILFNNISNPVESESESSGGGGGGGGSSSSTGSDSTPTADVVPEIAPSEEVIAAIEAGELTASIQAIGTETSSESGSNADTSGFSPTGKAFSSGENLESNPPTTVKKVKVTFTNTGTKTMKLRAEPKFSASNLSDEANIRKVLEKRLSVHSLVGSVEEQITTLKLTEENKVKVISTGKKLGGGGFIGRLFALFVNAVNPSGAHTTGELLRPKIIGDPEVVIPPGTTIEKEYDVRLPLSIHSKKEVELGFSAGEEEVLEKLVGTTESLRFGSEVVVDQNKNTMELYVTVPQIDGKSQENSEYTLEWAIYKNSSNSLNTEFIDLLGPFIIPNNEQQILSQEFSYNSELYEGDYVVVLRLLEGRDVKSLNTYPMKFKITNKQDSNLVGGAYQKSGVKTKLKGTLLFILLVVVLGGVIVLTYRHGRMLISNWRNNELITSFHSKSTKIKQKKIISSKAIKIKLKTDEQGLRKLFQSKSLPWLEDWMTSMLEQGHSINKAKSLANHHPKVSEQMSEIALARVLALIEIKKKYDLPKKEIKRLKKFVMTNINSMRTDEISQQLTNVGWEHRIIDPFVQAYSHEIKKRNFVGHKVFQISKKLSRSKIKTNRKISVRDLESLKRYIHYHPAKNAEMKDIVDQLIQDGERGEIPISNNQP